MKDITKMLKGLSFILDAQPDYEKGLKFNMGKEETLKTVQEGLAATQEFLYNLITDNNDTGSWNTTRKICYDCKHLSSVHFISYCGACGKEVDTMAMKGWLDECGA